MADPTPTAQVKIETEMASLLGAHSGLSGWTIETNLALDEAIEGETVNAIVIRTMGVNYDQSFEPNSQILCRAIVDIEAVVKEAGVKIPQRAQEALGHVVAALLDDYTLGGRLQDLVERDLSPGDGDRREAGAISLQFNADYLTKPADRFTIVGHGGVEF